MRREARVFATTDRDRKSVVSSDLAFAADSQWVLKQSTLTYHVSHPLHESEGVSHAARGKGVCHDGQRSEERRVFRSLVCCGQPMGPQTKHTDLPCVAPTA